jgi:hypothetical protein
MNVAFANGWIADEDGRVFIYYASSDTRLHVATSTIDKLVDYCMNTPEDGLYTAASVQTIKKLIDIYKANGIKKIDFKEYPGDRHEILNENDKENVENDIIAWLGQI